MSAPSFIEFSSANRRLFFVLICCHLTWACLVLGLWAFGGIYQGYSPLLSGLFSLFQIFTAAQLILPVLLFKAEERDRRFYLFWGGMLFVLVWVSSLINPAGSWRTVAAALHTSLLLFVATIIGAVLARYVNRLWEIIPVCLVMTMADYASWVAGPTAGFVSQLQDYYTTFEGTPPMVDKVLIKIAQPGSPVLSPVFGVSDWIMVVFFALVARHFNLNDNLLGASGVDLARAGLLMRYLPVSVFALLLALGLSQLTGMFIPALPMIALTMLSWYGMRYLFGAKL